MSVISRTPETNAVRDYFVSALAGPRIAGQRVRKGEKVRLAEYQARGHVAAGELVTEEARVDDPWGEVAAAAAKREAAEKSAAETAGATGPTGSAAPAGATGPTGGAAPSAGATGPTGPAA